MEKKENIFFLTFKTIKKNIKINILKQSQRFLAGGNSHSPKYGLKSKHEKI